MMGSGNRLDGVLAYGFRHMVGVVVKDHWVVGVLDDHDDFLKIFMIEWWFATYMTIYVECE